MIKMYLHTQKLLNKLFLSFDFFDQNIVMAN